MRSFFETLPNELIESASMEGCSPFQIFLRIMLPLGLPGMGSVGLFQFIWFWDEFVLALTFIRDEDKLTLPAGLASLQGEYFVDYPVLAAGLVITIIPVVIVILFSHKYFIKGLTMGALKA